MHRHPGLGFNPNWTQTAYAETQGARHGPASCARERFPGSGLVNAAPESRTNQCSRSTAHRNAWGSVKPAACA